jgi:hypothetical protein
MIKHFIKQATLMRRSTVLSLPPQLVFPGKTMDKLSPSNKTTVGPYYQL